MTSFLLHFFKESPNLLSIPSNLCVILAFFSHHQDFPFKPWPSQEYFQVMCHCYWKSWTLKKRRNWVKNKTISFNHHKYFLFLKFKQNQNLLWSNVHHIWFYTTRFHMVCFTIPKFPLKTTTKIKTKIHSPRLFHIYHSFYHINLNKTNKEKKVIWE